MFQTLNYLDGDFFIRVIVKLDPHILFQSILNIGFKLSVYPLPLLGVCITAMQKALKGLKEGNVPENDYTFGGIKDVVGFSKYFNDLKTFETYGVDFSKQQ